MSDDYYKNMFQAAVSTLAAIDRELELPDDGCNSPAQTLEEIRRRKALIADLSMLVRRLVLDVRALADDEGPEAARLSRANNAMEFLRRNELLGSPLRDASPPLPAQPTEQPK